MNKLIIASLAIGITLWIGACGDTSSQGNANQNSTQNENSNLNTNGNTNINGNANENAGPCTDICEFAKDGECDDGRPGAATDYCTFGTDCTDCGPGEG